MNEQFTTVIFDIGNVLMDFEWRAFTKRVLPDEEVRQKVNEAIFGNHLWDEMDRGTLDDRQVLEKAVQVHPELEEQIRYVFDHAEESLFPMEYAIPWVQEVKSLGYQVLYLSNYSHYIMSKGPDALSFLPYMDGGVFSCDVHLVKPERAIYEKICEEYKLDKSRCLFIDDNPDNILAANEFGLHAFWFEGYEKSYPEIMKILRGSGGCAGT